MSRFPTVARTWRENRRNFIGWAIGINALVWMELAVYPTIRGMKDFEKIINQYPKELKAFFDIQGGMSFSDARGFLSAELFSIMVPMIAILYGVFLAVRVVATEENQGYTDLYLSAPITRSRYSWEKAAAVVLGVAALMGTVLFSLVVGNELISMEMSFASMFAPVVTTFGLVLGCSMLAFSIATGFGYKGMAIAVAVGISVFGYLADSLAKITESLRMLKYASVFHFLSASTAMQDSVDWIAVVVSILIALAAAVIGVLAFKRRDLHV